MDPASTPGYLDRRTAALSGVCLERTIELDNVRLAVRDWPGLGRPVVHIPDPLRDSDLVLRISAVLQPRYRILSIRLRPDQPYQVHVADLHGVLAQFGLDDVVVVAEGLSCASALLLAAWYPEHACALLLVDSRPAEDDALIARSLRDCPPDWPRVRRDVGCAVLDLVGTDTRLVDELQTLLG